MGYIIIHSLVLPVDMTTCDSRDRNTAEGSWKLVLTCGAKLQAIFQDTKVTSKLQFFGVNCIELRFKSVLHSVSFVGNYSLSHFPSFCELPSGLT